MSRNRNNRRFGGENGNNGETKSGENRNGENRNSENRGNGAPRQGQPRKAGNAANGGAGSVQNGRGAGEKQNFRGERRQNVNSPKQNGGNAGNGQNRNGNAAPANNTGGNNANRFRGNNNGGKQKNRAANVANNGNRNAGAVNRNDENRKDTYVYELDGNVYINLTNKCSNGCEFCVRNERASYYGNYLWIRHGDPTAEQVIAALSGKNLSAYKELVFCGFGEPTYKMNEMIAVADFAHEKGMKTRLNTNGQGNLINKRDIVPELKGKIDLVNVSLNAPDAESYQKICHSMFRLDAFPALVEFAKSCVKNGVACRFSVVDCIGEDAVASCKRLAESAGVPLYVRKYIADS